MACAALRAALSAALRATFKSVPPCRDGTHSARDARASPTLSTTALAAPAVPAVAPTAIATAAITATSVASGLFRRQRDLVR